jgi:hypothetical protein
MWNLSVEVISATQKRERKLTQFNARTELHKPLSGAVHRMEVKIVDGLGISQ